MKRFLLAAVVLVGYSVVGALAFGAEDDDDVGPTLYDKTYEVKTAEFEDQVIETDHFVINNILLTRARNDYDSDKLMERLTFGASIKGRSAKSQETSVMLAGYDDKKTLLWTAKAGDSMYGKSVGSMNDQVRVPVGTFKNTAMIWMRVVVVTKSN